MVTKNRARRPEANADCLIVTRKITDLADFDESFGLNYGLLGWRSQVCSGDRPDSRVKNQLLKTEKNNLIPSVFAKKAFHSSVSGYYSGLVSTPVARPI